MLDDDGKRKSSQKRTIGAPLLIALGIAIGYSLGIAIGYNSAGCVSTTPTPDTSGLQKHHLEVGAHSGIKVALLKATTSPPQEARPPQEQQSQVGLQTTSVWASDLLSASETITFKKLNQEGSQFWIAMENSFHSVEFILQHELSNVAWWIRVVKAANEKQGHCRVLDVGSNAGFYALLSRSIGCEVIAIDAQPRCLHRLRSAAAVNGFVQGLDARWAAVSNEPGEAETDSDKCSGLWGVDNKLWQDDNPNGVPGENSRKVKVKMATMPELLQDWLPAGKHIDMMKIDTEGHEFEVLRSTLPYLQKRQVHNIMFEVKLERKMTPKADLLSLMGTLYDLGYQCGPVGRDRLSKESLLSGFSQDFISPPDWSCILTGA